MRQPAATDFARVACELLSTDETRRLLASELMFGMMTFYSDNDQEAQCRRLLRESLALLPDRATFVPALLSYWGEIMEADYIQRMAPFTRRGLSLSDPPADDGKGWLSPQQQQYPIQHLSEEDPFSCSIRLIGAQMWLEQAVGPQDIALLPQLIACLSHSEPVCQDAAVKMLTAIGENAHGNHTMQPVLQALQQRIAGKGHWCNPFIDGIAIARIIGNNTDAWLAMADTITEDSPQTLIEGYSSCFCEITTPSTALIDRLLQKLAQMPHKREKQLHDLLICVARLAQRARYRCSDVRAFALSLVDATSAITRRGTAFALEYVAQLPDDEALLIRLAGDSDETVRNAAHHGARCVTTPSSALVEHTARNLDNFDMCDGLPHDTAVITLAGWGGQIIPALPHIERWLKALATSPWDYEHLSEQELTLIENLGDTAQPLLPLLQQYYAATFDDDNEDDDEDEDADDRRDDSPHNDDTGHSGISDINIDLASIRPDAMDCSGDTLWDKTEALALLLQQLQNNAVSIRTPDNKDHLLDSETLAAIQSWEQYVIPLLMQLKQRIDDGETILDSQTRIALEQLAEEGHILVTELLTHGISTLFGGEELVFGDDDETYTRKQAAREAFIAEMGLTDLGTPDHDDSRTEDDAPGARLQQLIARLGATS